MNAALSLDMDDKWTYLKTHGDPNWASSTSYHPIVIPRILEMLKELGLKITFFIVAKDLLVESSRPAFASLVAAGHDVGNHSLGHEPWLHRYTPEEVEQDLGAAHTIISGTLGVQPIGFRGPGYSFSAATLRVIADLGYIFDASTLPTFLGPLARLYYFATASFSAKEQDDRAILFGSWSEGLRPLKPYRWQVGSQPVLEIPVTTMPFLRLPFHVSYILYLSRFSECLAKTYFKSSLALCKASGVEPSLLLHPLDFLSHEDTTELSFFPGMDIPIERKLRLTKWALAEYARVFSVQSLNDYARHAAEHDGLRIYSPEQTGVQA